MVFWVVLKNSVALNLYIFNLEFSLFLLLFFSYLFFDSMVAAAYAYCECGVSARQLAS